MSVAEISFVSGLVVGSAVTAVVSVAIMRSRRAEIIRIAEQHFFIAGRNYERVKHGEELLFPPPDITAPTTQEVQ